jgi:NADPH-dependent ferric siderophore reductase
LAAPAPNCHRDNVLTIKEIPMTKHAIARVRHEARRRILTVKEVGRLTPNMVRITLGGDLSGFVSSAYDDHMKVFFPFPGQSAPAIPVQGPNGPVHPEGSERSPGRDYTPRRYDISRGELVIDFAIHDAGPATAWAAKARPGQQIGVGGPRGSFVVPDDFDWYLFVGDETALPAIGRRLEELRAGTRAIVVAAVAGPDEQQTFASKAGVETVWVHRPLSRAEDPALLLDTVRALTLPTTGDGYCWAAGESQTAKLLRQHLVGDRGFDKAWVKAAGYWKRGAVSIHETHND